LTQQKSPPTPDLIPAKSIQIKGKGVIHLARLFAFKKASASTSEFIFLLELKGKKLGMIKTLPTNQRPLQTNRPFLKKDVLQLTHLTLKN
jgi:hypothetical protein